MGVFAGFTSRLNTHTEYYSSTSRYSVSLSQNQPVSAKFQTSERGQYVGVDDEQIYISVPNAQQAANAQPVNNAYDSVDAHPSDENASANAQPVPEEYDEVDDADPLEVHVLHDPENPNIVKRALFPDIIAFRKAIRHHAVKTGFKFAGLKTDKTRFLAHCAAEGCPWRIHASTIFDKKTIKVMC